ncbi:uncharacterized protein LOC131218150 [Magnolia sinica]|uniref:uncharacterized protein LOC131218150 n=1 Tax=Magnolia sinica TaxID=86752 RepID=UPI00265A9D79|nr:uncharacterized protein LOC131218150 [Magnolia sinica]
MDGWIADKHKGVPHPTFCQRLSLEIRIRSTPPGFQNPSSAPLFALFLFSLFPSSIEKSSIERKNPASVTKIRQLVLQDSFRNPRGRKRYIQPDTRPIRQDSPKNRELLGAFWDKLSLDEAMEIASLKNATLEVIE